MKTITFSFFILFTFHQINGNGIVDQCCEEGKSRAEQGEECLLPPSVANRITRSHQAICSTTSAICCLGTYRRLMCGVGVEAAKQSQLCISLTQTTGGEYYKDCCDACKLGIALKNSGDTSNCDPVTNSFDFPWEEAYRDCCLGLNFTSSTSANPPTVDGNDNSNKITSGVSTAAPTAPTPNYQRTEPSNRLPIFLNVTAAPFSAPSTTLGSRSHLGCRHQPNLCDHLCIDTATGHFCQCYSGYSLHQDGRSCISTSSRCQNSNPCHQLCTDTGDAIICNCKLGYELQNDRRTCLDIDECALDEDECDLATQNCVNNPGGYECVRRTEHGSVAVEDESDAEYKSDSASDLLSLSNCETGYQYNSQTHECEDIDECILGFDNCDKRTHFCANQEGGYTCNERQSTSQCPPGYEFNQTLSSCVDVNECERGLDACDHTREFCFNFQGTYECQRKTQSSCPAGYKYSKTGKSCEDVDECVEKLHNCDEQVETCKNTEGGYECDVKCLVGYRQSPSGQCTDIDECSEGTDKCVAGGSCINTLGSYQCTNRERIRVNCPAGYKPSADGKCLDIDECAEKAHSCDEEHEDCVNEVGQYQCVEKPIRKCQHGFKSDPTNPHNCIDVDECAEVKDNCLREKEKCVNTNGGFHCEPIIEKPPACPPGHNFNVSTKQCQDINECELQSDTCDRSKEICLNTNGSFRCWLVDCPPGYKPNTTAKACEDVDECVEKLHNCTARENCVNYRGGFSCIAAMDCHQGFKFNAQTQACEDIDECEQKLHTCNLNTSDCRNTPGGFVCFKLPHCPSGYRYVNGESRRCVDVDECAENTHNCQTQSEICYNTRGSYRCLPQSVRPLVPTTTPPPTTTITTPSPTPTPTTPSTSPIPRQYCPTGYKFSQEKRTCVDINECQHGSHTCLSTQRCDNTIGSFTCIRLTGCGTGYTLNAHSNQCEDDDECELGNHNCGILYVCRNTLGSFRCDRKTCPYGHRLVVDGSCQLATCEAGMKPDASGNCVDINECENPGLCRSYERCINTAGSYRCQSLVNCGPGYELDSDGAKCIDVDECTRGNHECRGGQQCINRAGGYLCQCPAGYFLNYKRECEDIDECTRYGKVCAQNSECVNTPGSYQCKCKDGFQHGENDRTCKDIDECELYKNICQHKCINTWGSHQCTCNPGYTLGEDKRTCTDIDECSLYKGPGNLCIGDCVNEPGSYSCSCPSGYQLGPDTRTCQDLDECAQNNVCKGENEVCLNTRGGYKCNQISCPPGYVKDPSHKNRCKRESSVCRQGDLECIKQPLSYSYNFLTFVSNLPIPPSGYINLFTMRGPPFQDIGAEFDLEDQGSTLNSTLSFFQLRRTGYNQGIISIVKSIPGPQNIQLKLAMNLYRGSVFGGVAVAKIFIYVTEHEF